MINGISSGQMLKLQNFSGGRKLTTEKMFGMISIQLGGDGKTITRNQLQQYIQKADNGLINCAYKQLKAFKLLDDNWKDLFGDSDSITARDFNKAAGIFAQIILAKDDKSDIEKLQEELQKQIEKQKKTREEQEKNLKEKQDKEKEEDKKVEETEEDNTDEGKIINNLIEKNTTYTKSGTTKPSESTTKNSTVEYKI